MGSLESESALEFSGQNDVVFFEFGDEKAGVGEHFIVLDVVGEERVKVVKRVVRHQSIHEQELQNLERRQRVRLLPEQLQEVLTRDSVCG